MLRYLAKLSVPLQRDLARLEGTAGLQDRHTESGGHDDGQHYDGEHGQGGGFCWGALP